MNSTTNYNPPIPLENYSEYVTSISDGCPSKDKFDYVYLNTILFEKDGEVFATKHYPLDDCILPSNMPMQEEEYEAILTKKLHNIKKSHVVSLEEYMQVYIKENPDKRGTVYFSPANKFACINTQAKELYVFGFKSPEGKLEIQSESNYIIV